MGPGRLWGTPSMWGEPTESFSAWSKRRDEATWAFPASPSPPRSTSILSASPVLLIASFA